MVYRRVPPHLAAPEVILRRNLIEQATPIEIRVTRRLPQDTTDLVKAFYDFGFTTDEDLRERSLALENLLALSFRSSEKCWRAAQSQD